MDFPSFWTTCSLDIMRNQNTLVTSVSLCHPISLRDQILCFSRRTTHSSSSHVLNLPILMLFVTVGDMPDSNHPTCTPWDLISVQHLIYLPIWTIHNLRNSLKVSIQKAIVYNPIIVGRVSRKQRSFVHANEIKHNLYLMRLVRKLNHASFTFWQINGKPMRPESHLH